MVFLWIILLFSLSKKTFVTKKHLLPEMIFCVEKNKKPIDNFVKCTLVLSKSTLVALESTKVLFLP